MCVQFINTFTIRNNQTVWKGRVYHYQDPETGLWGGVIDFHQADHTHTELLSTLITYRSEQAVEEVIATMVANLLSIKDQLQVCQPILIDRSPEAWIVNSTQDPVTHRWGGIAVIKQDHSPDCTTISADPIYTSAEEAIQVIKSLLQTVRHSE